MTYTTSQNIKTRTTYMAAALFATLILVAEIAALAMYPAEAFAKPLCDENGPCYASSRRILSISSIPTMPNAISFSLKRQFANAPPGSRDPRTYRTYVRCFCCVIVSARARHVVKSAFEQSGQQCLA